MTYEQPQHWHFPFENPSHSVDVRKGNVYFPIALSGRTHLADNIIILYHFDWFGQHVTFSSFRKISENRKNREKIISGVSKKWVWRVTAESIEMVQYIKPQWNPHVKMLQVLVICMGMMQGRMTDIRLWSRFTLQRALPPLPSSSLWRSVYINTITPTSSLFPD